MDAAVILELTGLIRIGLQALEKYSREGEISQEELDLAETHMQQSLARARAIVAGPQDT